MESKLYIDLLKKMLTDYHRIGSIEYKPLKSNHNNIFYKTLIAFDRILRRKDFAICKAQFSTLSARMEGKDWPANADTMIGLKRLENIEYCVNKIIEDNIPGDLIETGVWRGGASIFMKALLKVNNIEDRFLWLADSFEGLPKPDEDKYTADKGDKHHTWSELAISIDTVKSNFQKYGLLDDNVKFLKGWFKDTLPSAPVEKLALLRLDGDMYESTMDGLTNLYHKLSVGGFIIVDDWGAVPGCQRAVIEFREKYRITENIEIIDWTGVYWRKEKDIE
jgi:O-methyltransferase